MAYSAARVSRSLVLALVSGLAVGLAAGCHGPDAPDAVLCRDVVTRLCLGPVCTAVASSLSVTADDCEATLLSRTGCGADSFAFTTPDRARFLECRRPLVRASDSTYVKAPCPDVDELFATCPDVTAFLKGGLP